VTQLDQFLAGSAIAEGVPLGALRKANDLTDRLAVYSLFEADFRAQAAQPVASPLVRWMLTRQDEASAGSTSQAMPAGLINRL
jgi:hypothetical protein